MYYVIRILFKGEIETHSIEQKNTLREALTRWYSIAATDIGNQDTTFSYTIIVDEEGNAVQDPIIFSTLYDEMGMIQTPYRYAVIRIRIKNNALNNSIEYKEYVEAYKRYFNIIAADLQDEEVSYQMTLLINLGENITENRVFRKESEE